RMGNLMRSAIGRPDVSTDTCDGSLKAPEGDIVVLQDYPSAEISEPIYRIGEKLKLVAQGAYWWQVRSVQTGQENIIPNSHAAKVYHGWLFEGVGRQKAEELLSLPGNKVGSFMVRESSRERGTYSLSVKHRSVKHYRIYRLDNSWYYISPSLTFQCLEDMINHYSELADGLCSVLTSPCLSAAIAPLDRSPGAPPVVMRRNFDWNKVDRGQLVSADSCDDSVLSYGVRNSIAAYLSFSESPEATHRRAESRKKKSRSVYVLPDTDYDA
uniref:Src like adaptor 1a n=2 Tax=Takifugu rubripes TaxID=31033 RepID=A0A674N7J6_TAKRU